MNHLKINASWILFAAAFSTAWQVQPETFSHKVTDSYEVTGASKIWVEGTSTIRNWTCEARETEGSVRMTWEDGFTPVIESVQISIPVGKMDCGNGAMDKKLRKALKFKETPNMLFELNEAFAVTEADADSIEVTTDGFLMIAGQTRRIQLTQYASILDDGSIIFRGSIPISMKDYNIKRPSALLGTIKAGNDVVIYFELVVARIQDAS